jgi:hypothetical protein
MTDVVISLLQAYVARHGTIPSVFEEVDGVALGKICVHYRQQHRQGKMSAADARRLEETVPGWWWTCFDKMHAALAEYLPTHGNIVPTHEVVWNGLNLGVWCFTQRISFRKGKLSPDRVQRLQALQGWRWTPMHNFETHVATIKTFARNNGGQLPDAADVENLGLSLWWGTQLRLYHQGRLQPDRIAELEAVPGWSWDNAPQVRFNDKIEALQDQGGALPSFGEALGWWCNRQKELYVSNRLSQQRAESLEALPGWDWTARQSFVTEEVNIAPPTVAPARKLRMSTRRQSARKSVRLQRRSVKH